MAKKQKCDVYSRVVGYLSPVSEWNKGKKEEFKDRKEYKADADKEGWYCGYGKDSKKTI